jgi:replicative DNA helicase
MGLFDGVNADFASRTPPMNIQVEMGLLGALLCNNKMIEHCDRLRPEHFAGEGLADLYEAILDAISLGTPIDINLAQDKFPKALLLDCQQAMVGIGAIYTSFATYAADIRQNYLRRKAIEIWLSKAEDAFNPSVAIEDIASAAGQQIDNVMTGQIASSITCINDLLGDAMSASERARGGKTSGISSGFAAVDARLNGFEPQLIYVLGGRPGSGKSAFAHQIGINIARQGIPVLEIALEMSGIQLARRALSMVSGIPLGRIQSGQTSDEEVERLVVAQREMHGLPLYIDDSFGQTAAQVALKVRAAKRKYGIRFLMIDHLNLMAPEVQDARHGGTWVTERASATVLQIAKQCEVPVLLLAQLNRGVEAREDKRPGLADLRQSGAIEQDAYAVAFMYREEYYCGTAPEQRANERHEAYATRLSEWHTHRERILGKAELIWAKVRDGQPGSDYFEFDGQTTSFRERV